MVRAEKCMEDRLVKRQTEDRSVEFVVWALLLTVSGTSCGIETLPPFAATSEVLLGNDSAGATIRIEKVEDTLTHARVVDVVLGAGEAEVLIESSNQISFTIEFSVGVRITYDGVLAHSEVSDVEVIEGTWTQHAAGIFGEDTGTWEVRTDL